MNKHSRLLSESVSDEQNKFYDIETSLPTSWPARSCSGTFLVWSRLAARGQAIRDLLSSNFLSPSGPTSVSAHDLPPPRPMLENSFTL